MFAFLRVLIFGCNFLSFSTAGKGTQRCVFPFIFDGKSYSSCTKDGVSDKQLWCATTANYDKDGRWKLCSLQEYGGNSGGKSCCFPFIYKNRTFYTCTDENKEKGRFWCATTRNYDRDAKWSYCADTRLDDAPKGPCVFPFIFNNQSYSSCTTEGLSTKKLWCSLTSNYDVDMKWTHCEPSGPDPKVESPSCVFPFLYNGKFYRRCTNEGTSDGQFWCATTSNYDMDKKWIYCNVTGPEISKEAPSCVFPFIYKGKIYTNCTEDGQRGGQPWCATTANYDVDQKWIYCSVRETACAFPFVYKGKSYFNCITLDRFEKDLVNAWCSTTPNYDINFKWRLCNESDCVFPFDFRGKTYHNCTRAGYKDKKPWCSLTRNADTDKMRLLCADKHKGISGGIRKSNKPNN